MIAVILPSALPEIGVHAFRDWYRSPEVLAAENEHLIARSWQIVATSAELADPGSYLTTIVAGYPLVVVHDENRSLRAFHNLCRHRGIPLVSGRGAVGRYLTCPYHQWSYRRDGSLATVPQRDSQFPGIDCDKLSLLPAAVGEWAGIVFVQTQPDGTTLDDALGELVGRLGPYSSDAMVEVAKAEFDIACNWKLLVENHVDVYHLWYLHDESLRPLDHSRFYWEFLGDNWWSTEPHKDPGDAPAELPWLSPADANAIGAHLLFPNVMIVTCGSYLATYDAVPTAPDATRLTLRIRSLPGTDGDGFIKSVRRFLDEDIGACEQLQIGTGSPAFCFGPTAADHEEPVRVFHEAIRSRVAGLGSSC